MIGEKADLTYTYDYLGAGVETLNDVIAATTVNAAMALRRPELGSLKVGSAGDASCKAASQAALGSGCLAMCVHHAVTVMVVKRRLRQRVIFVKGVVVPVLVPAAISAMFRLKRSHGGLHG